jgi:hypothetical protein
LVARTSTISEAVADPRRRRDKKGEMHASIWRFAGDPDDLLARYDAMVADVPDENMRLHLCLRATDGIILVDTCPTREVFEAFASDEGYRDLRRRHGLPEPESIEDFPVHVAFVDGRVAGSEE